MSFTRIKWLQSWRLISNVTSDKWFVTFNASKTKFLSNNKFKDPFLPSVMMNATELPENNHFHFFGLSFKTAAMKVGSLCRVWNFLSTESSLYLYKATICPYIE